MRKRANKRDYSFVYLAVSIVIIFILLGIGFKLSADNSEAGVTGEPIYYFHEEQDGRYGDRFAPHYYCSEIDILSEVGNGINPAVPATSRFIATQYEGKNFFIPIDPGIKKIGLETMAVASDECVDSNGKSLVDKNGDPLPPNKHIYSDHLKEYYCTDKYEIYTETNIGETVLTCKCVDGKCGGLFNSYCVGEDKTLLKENIGKHIFVKGSIMYAGGAKGANVKIEDRCINEFFLEEFYCGDTKGFSAWSVAVDCRSYGAKCDSSLGACVKLPPPTTAPTTQVGSGSVIVQVSSPVSQATKYKVQYDISSKFSTAVTKEFEGLYIVLEDVKYSTTYYVRVAACNAGGCGPWSAVKTAKTPVAPPAGSPSSPSEIYALRQSNKDALIVWSDVSGETDYQIFRGTSLLGSYARIRTIKSSEANTVRFIDSGLSSTRTYYYKIRACKKAGLSTICGSYTTPVFVGLYSA